MKKILLLSTLLSLLLLTSCSFFSKKEDAPVALSDETQLQRMIGVVNPPEALGILTAPSKFVLIVENKEPIFIDSASVNLRKYKGRRVEAEGKWNDSKTVFLLENVVSLTQDASSKTLYQNAELGIKFQYPSLWILKEEKSVLGILKIFITPYEVDDTDRDSIDTITIERSENNRRLPPREWLGLDEQYRKADALTYQQSRIGSLQLDAVKVTEGTGEQIKFYVARDTFIYEFSHKTTGDSEKDQYRNSFYDMVMSFEFIPFGDSVGTSSPAAQKPFPPPALYPTPSSTLSGLAGDELQERQAQEDAQKKATMLSQSRQTFIDYIKSHISELAPEPPSVGGTWSVQSVEFAYPEGQPENWSSLYIVYEDGHELRKILLSVPDQKAPEKMTRVAYFKPGSSTDWQLTEGTDTAKGTERSKINLTSTNGEEVSIKKGMTLLEARSFKVKIQYPSSWYWAYRNTGYSFSNKPVAGENVLIHLTKNPETLPENMASIGELGGKAAVEGEMAEALSVCVQGDAKYCLSGDPSYKDVMHQMLGTLQE